MNAELTPGITVEHQAEKHRYLVRENGRKRLYVFSRGMRREGELWVIVDAEYAQLMEMRGMTETAAIARATTLLRDGTIDRLIDERRDRRRVGMMAALGAIRPRR
jgi:hypothetical protein